MGMGGGGTQTTTQTNEPMSAAKPSYNNYYRMLNEWYFPKNYTGSSQSQLPNMINATSTGGATGGSQPLMGTPFGSEYWNNGMSPNEAIKTYFTDNAGNNANSNMFEQYNVSGQQPSSEPGWMQLARDRFVGADPATEKAWSYLEGQADPNNASSYLYGGLNALRDTASGSYLNKNPYLDAMYGNAADQVASKVNSMFGAGGRSGSGINQSVMTQDLGNLAENMYGNNYANERRLQTLAASQLPGFAAMPADYLGKVGNERRGYAEQYMNAPLMSALQFGQALSPGAGFGTSTTSQPLYSNYGGLGSLLGMGAGLALAPTGATGAALMPWLFGGSMAGGGGR